MGRRPLWPKRKPESCPECGKEFKFLAQHIRMKHGKETAVAEEKPKDAEEDKAPFMEIDPKITKAIEGIGDRLTRIDEDFCSKFPDLCAKVDKSEQAIPDTVEPGSERWMTTRKADLEHALFGDCPDCNPIRDALLAAKGKRLADVEVEVKVEAKVEAKVDDPDAKVEDAEVKDEVEAKVEDVEVKEEEEAETPAEESPDKREAPGYFTGSKWDPVKELDVEQ